MSQHTLSAIVSSIGVKRSHDEIEAEQSLVRDREQVAVSAARLKKLRLDTSIYSRHSVTINANERHVVRDGVGICETIDMPEDIDVNLETKVYAGKFTPYTKLI